MFGCTEGLRAKALCSIIQLLSCVAACCSLVALCQHCNKAIIIIIIIIMCVCVCVCVQTYGVLTLVTTSAGRPVRRVWRGPVSPGSVSTRRPAALSSSIALPSPTRSRLRQAARQSATSLIRQYGWPGGFQATSARHRCLDTPLNTSVTWLDRCPLLT